MSSEAYQNPWAEVVDRYFSIPDSRRSQARTLVDSDSLEHALFAIDHVEADRDSGSVSVGWGFVEVSTPAGDAWWRIEAQRRGEVWVITRLVPGEQRESGITWFEAKAIGQRWHPAPR